MTQGCWATKRRCSFERTRLGSLRARALLSIFGRGSVLGEELELSSTFCFARAMARLLRCATRFLSDHASRGRAVGPLVDGAHGVDIALPNGEQLLDVNRFRERFAKRRAEFISPGETLARPTGEAQQPRAAIPRAKG